MATAFTEKIHKNKISKVHNYKTNPSLKIHNQRKTPNYIWRIKQMIGAGYQIQEDKFRHFNRCLITTES